MTKVRKKIGNIPINTIKQDLQSTVDSSVAQMQQDVTDFIDEETAQYPEIGGAFKFQEDPEGRSEITTDAEGKVISYRDSKGVKHENVGIESDAVTFNIVNAKKLNGLSEEGKSELATIINNTPKEKKWYLPEFGKINIKEETFYLDAGDWSSYTDDVIPVQIYDDTDLNASKRLTLSTFYIKNTLTPLAGGGYDRTSINANSVALELHAGKDVVSINNKFFATAIYTPVMNGEYIVDYTKNKATKVTDQETGEVIGYTYNNKSTEVKRVKDVPPYKAWKVNKAIEHYCLADVDFGAYYSKNNDTVSIKYQGSGSTSFIKRGFRITFYKNNTYAKKDKMKFGEMIRLSGFNMKSFSTDSTRVKDPILNYLFIEMWETKGEDSYPWNKDSVPYNGATGFIKSFPIETWFGNEFFGLQIFGVKKDEGNYMLNGDDDSSGIFVCGDKNSSTAWQDANHLDWEDEMMDEMSQETAAALDELFKYTKGFVDGTIEIDGQQVEFTNDMLEEHIDIKSWVDYWIGLELFSLWDNTYRNIILHTRRDKKKFYIFFNDMDNSLGFAYNSDFVETVTQPSFGTQVDMSFWVKFRSEYKDSILNRYYELRKTILTKDNIYAIYSSFVKHIPNRVIEAERTRWGGTITPKNFENSIEYLDKRMNYLDNNYFNL